MVVPCIDPSGDIQFMNNGNFGAYLQIRIQSGDVALEKHHRRTASKATHISETVQSEL
jgi:hypothetical protein